MPTSPRTLLFPRTACGPLRRSLVLGLAGLALWTSAADVGLAGARHKALRHRLVVSHRVRETTRDGLPNLQSPVAYVVEWPSGRVILERDADLVRPIASLSKLMATLVISDDCHLVGTQLQEISPTARAAAALQGGNRYSKLRVGWSYSVTDLLHAAMLKSDNKALPALAEACGLDAAGLGRKMTERARAMGLLHTAFIEPDGLSEQNVSTAREMATVLKAVTANDQLRAIMAKGKWTIVGHKGARTESVNLKNTDQLVSRDIVEAIGGKTGFTNVARYCLAAAAKLPKTSVTPAAASLGMVFLGGEGRDTRFGDFMRVYKWMTVAETAKARLSHKETIKLASVLMSTAPSATVVAGGTAAAAALLPPAGAGAAGTQPAAPAVLAPTPGQAAPGAGGSAPATKAAGDTQASVTSRAAGGAALIETSPGLLSRLVGLIKSTAGG